MIAKTGMKIAIGVAVAMIVSLSGTVIWLELANSKLETELAQEQTRCTELSGRLTVCQGNSGRLETALSEQNAALLEAQAEAEKVNQEANDNAMVAHGRLTALLESDKHTSADAEGMNQWLESLFY